MSDILTAERVETIFRDCLFKGEEDKSEFIPAYGIMTNVGFHPGRLEEHKEEIVQMLNELPIEFHEAGGKGMSFLNACDDRHGKQWTGLHQRMEQLFQLGLAIGKVNYPLSREMWAILPGGMPYFMVTTEIKPVEKMRQVPA